MIVSNQSWHVRVYHWWYENKYGGRNVRSNLCPYMRAVMFWAPLRAIFSDWIELTRWKIPLNYITIPIIVISLPFLVGYLSYGGKVTIWIIYAVLTGIAIVLSLGFGIAWLFDEDGMNWSEHLDNRVKGVKESSFWQLLQEYLRSAHDRVCPEIEFNGIDVAVWENEGGSRRER